MDSMTGSIKLKEIGERIGEKETLIDPQYRKIDKYGRLQVGLNFANEEVLVIYLKPQPGDKERWVKV